MTDMIILQQKKIPNLYLKIIKFIYIIYFVFILKNFYKIFITLKKNDKENIFIL